ncbi:MAG: inositol monophosphatase [Muribaculaceae bacterium]|nr:inositol monophosphatase [Muribaculaceae bacterium]
MFYNTLLLNAISWAREAGAVQLHYFRGNNLDIRTKLNDSDIVTAADKASERLLIGRILDAYPSHSILTEESGDIRHGNEYRWVIDPLDGTTNFSAGLPGFAVSIGIEHHGETIAGVVFAPYINELFHAVKGQGAFLNGSPVRHSAKTDIAGAVISTGYPVDKASGAEASNLDNIARVMPLVRGLRSLGAASLDLCYIAAGFLDGYWETNLHLWDVSAAMLILKEAGAECSRFRSDRNISIVAGTPVIHDRLRQLVS